MTPVPDASFLAKTAPLAVPHQTMNAAAAKKAGQQFEGVFVAQVLGSMFEGISTDPPFGGGEGEAMFRSLMLDEYGKQIAAQGGFGLAKAVTSELLKTQELRP